MHYLNVWALVFSIGFPLLDLGWLSPSQVCPEAALPGHTLFIKLTVGNQPPNVHMCVSMCSVCVCVYAEYVCVHVIHTHRGGGSEAFSRGRKAESMSQFKYKGRQAGELTISCLGEVSFVPSRPSPWITSTYILENSRVSSKLTDLTVSLIQKHAYGDI